MSFKMYRVELDYIRYLHSVDHRVQFNETKPDAYNQNRPYVGIVLEINGHNYFAPLEHPRPAHQSLKANTHIFKIKGGQYGLLALNNMIPIPAAQLVSFDINQDPNRNVLVTQYIICKKNAALIQEKAERIYTKRITRPNDFEKKIMCDFVQLEKAAAAYTPPRPRINNVIQNATKTAAERNNQKPLNNTKKNEHEL